MSTLSIVMHPAQVLEAPCEQVTKFDKQLGSFIDSMFKTMDDADGVGLAAPQVNVSKRIAVVDIGDGRIELVNPKVIENKGEQVGPEGCLSFPGLFGEVKRSFYIKIRAQDRRGKTFIMEAEDFLARAIQHEIDHLDGILFTEKVIRYYEEDELQ